MALEDRYRALPFPEAIAYLQQKINVDSDRAADVVDAQHDAAFVVAGAKGALLSELREAVTRALVEGQRLDDFQKRFNEITEGWTHFGNKAWRAKIIYDANIKMSHAAGRYEQIFNPDNLRLKPYLQYLHGNSANPRMHHLALNQRVFRAEDLPFYPPNGHGCSCKVISLSDRDLSRFSLEVSNIARGDTVPVTYKGQTFNAVIQPEKGFDYIPGQTNAERRDQMRQDLLSRMAPDIKHYASDEMKAADRTAAQQRRAATPSPDQKYQAIARRLFANELAEIDKVANAPESDSDRKLRQAEERLKGLVKQAQQTKDPKDIDKAKKLKQQIKDAKQRQKEQRQRRLMPAMERLRQSIIERSSIREQDVSIAVSAVTIDKSVEARVERDRLRESLADLLRMTNGKGLGSLETIKIDPSRDYGFASTKSRLISLGKVSDPILTLFHELGHHIEYESRERADNVVAWMQSRSTSNEPVSITAVFPNSPRDVMVYPGSWIHPYVGRYYPPTKDGITYTEVVSMGLERFITPEKMLEFYLLDPDHFLFVLGLLKS